MALSCQGRGTFVTPRPGAERPLQVQSTLRDLTAMLRGDGTQLLNLSEGDGGRERHRRGRGAVRFQPRRRISRHRSAPLLDATRGPR